jgi:hypothetical protein
MLAVFWLATRLGSVQTATVPMLPRSIIARVEAKVFEETDDEEEFWDGFEQNVVGAVDVRTKHFASWFNLRKAPTRLTVPASSGTSRRRQAVRQPIVPSLYSTLPRHLLCVNIEPNPLACTRYYDLSDAFGTCRFSSGTY